MTAPASSPSRDQALSRHILPTSGTMVGVCTTLIGLIKVVETHTGPSHVDEYTALVSLLFLVSAISSYASIRFATRQELSRRCEAVADQTFILGLLGIAVISVFFAYEVI